MMFSNLRLSQPPATQPNNNKPQQQQILAAQQHHNSSPLPTQVHAAMFFAPSPPDIKAPPHSPTKSSLSLSTTSPQPDALALAVAQTIPSELILHIFKYVTTTRDLRNCLLACRAWCHCGVELFWHKPVFYNPYPLVRMICVLGLVNPTFPYALFVRRLNLSNLSEDVSDSILARLAGCERLERITLAGCRKLTDSGLCKLLEGGTVVQTVVGDDNATPPNSTTTIAIPQGALVPGCGATLIAMDLSDLTELTDVAILAIAERCPRLQGLNLSN
ncbi:hypothetical protein BC938DRAFT_480708, partial [Jimgerdemannia flammicorona]